MGNEVEPNLNGTPVEIDRPSTSHSRDNLILPCKLSDFGDFIMGLVSKDQTIKGELEGVFDIGAKEVSNVFHLIDQRIKSQNDGQLLYFEIKVVYNDGASVTHTTVSDFESYYPVDNGFPVEIAMSLHYLLQFKGRDIPEKQEIDFVFSTYPNRSPERQRWYVAGLIEWKISHTERTWAADINGLLKSHAAASIDKFSGFWAWVVKYYEEVVNYSAWLVTATFIIYWLINTHQYLDKTPDTIQVARYFSTSIALYILLGIFIGLIVRLVTVQLVVRRGSFICLVDKDKERRTKAKSKATGRFVIYIFSVLTQILIGIGVSLIISSDWMTKLT